MKIALKYGLLITLGAVAWVVIAHLLVADPRSAVHTLGAGIFFNLIHIVGIFLAITTVKKQTGDELVFRDGVKTGVATAFVYALTFCLFFMVAILVVGPRLLASEPGMENQPLWQAALGAFAGLFLGSVIFGLIYSTLISFFLAKRRSQ